MKKNLTSLFVESVKPPATGQVDFWDQRIRGFGLRISYAGTKTWMCMYRLGRRQRRFKIGTYPPLTLADAREMARNALADVQKGYDPAEMKRAAVAAGSFGELVNQYMAHCEQHNRARTVSEKWLMVRSRLMPIWQHRPAASITRKEIVELVTSIGRVRGNRLAALISSIFSYALDHEIVSATPAIRIPKPGVERARERRLTSPEIGILWDSLDSESPTIAGIFRLALLTAQRRGEIAGMRWDELDLDNAWWTLPAKRTKANRMHRVPLVPTAVEIIRSVQSGPHDLVYVFRGKRVGTPVAHLDRALDRVRERSGIDFWLHDLRRTAATIMAELGVPGSTISRVLNHAIPGVTARHYDHYSYDAEKREALLKLEQHILGIIRDEMICSQHMICRVSGVSGVSSEETSAESSNILDCTRKHLEEGPVFPVFPRP
jgi:integrase